MTNDIYILPIPQKMTVKEDAFKVGKTFVKCDDDRIKPFIAEFDLNGDYPITFNACINEKTEYYTVNMTKDGIGVSYSDIEGAYRAATTVKQLMAQAENGELSTVEIEDYPSIKNRGYMLDISRGKLPKTEYLKGLVDLLSSLKYNELQLYVDAIVFDFKHFSKYTKETETLSASDIRMLADYCKERFIKLVPNINTFGHMSMWTAKEEIAPLAITGDDGKPSQTLNPLKKESIEFIEKLLDGYISCFDSDRVNVGMDETVDLGKNETKEACDKLGVGKVYTDYLGKICGIITDKYNKTPMFWDDIIFKHPEQLENVPENAIVMQWGYETEHHYDRNCKRISEKGLRFYVCPGTSMWGSYTGRSNNMLVNITSAAECGAYYGAEGFLLTEWGDEGHPQFPTTSYLPLLVGAGASWNCMSHDHEIAYGQRKELLYSCKRYMDEKLCKADKGFADKVFRMGNYYMFEDLHFNGTELYHLIRNQGEIKPCHKATYEKVGAYMKELRQEIENTDASERAKRDVLVNCDIVIAAALVIANGKSEKSCEMFDKIIPEFEALWMEDNHRTGLEIFTGFLKKNTE